MENLEYNLTFCIKRSHFSFKRNRVIKRKTKLSISDHGEFNLEYKHGSAHVEELANLISKVWILILIWKGPGEISDFVHHRVTD